MFRGGGTFLGHSVDRFIELVSSVTCCLLGADSDEKTVDVRMYHESFKVNDDIIYFVTIVPQLIGFVFQLKYTYFVLIH